MGVLARMAEQRGSLEDPSTPLSNPANWLVNLMGGPTKAGVSVNNATALELSPVYAAVRRISDDVAKLPLHTYERLPRGREKATGHHLYVLLKDRPNPYMSSFSFWEVSMGHVLTWGNTYSEIERDGSGRVIALWPLRPDRMEVVWTGTRKVYLYKHGGQDIPFRADEILHVPGFGFDGLVGYNPIRLARESLGLTKAAERYGASFFGNASRPSGVVTTPKTLSDAAHDRIRRSWEEQHRGTDNSHRVAILEEGLDWKQIGIPPEEAQFLESRKFQVSEVARWFQIAAHKIGDMERSTFNNIEHQSQEHLSDTIQPWVERIERAINWELFPESERGRFYARFLIQALLRPDSKSRGEYYKSLFGVGGLSPNEIREMEEMNPVEGGDQRFVPMNMVPIDQAREDDGPTSPSSPPTGPSGGGALASRDANLRRRQMLAMRPAFEDRAQQVVNRELIRVRRAVKSAHGGRDAASLLAWLDEYYEDFGDHVAEQFLPLLMSLAQTVYPTAIEEVGGEDLDIDPGTESNIVEYARAYGVRWSESSKGQLKTILRDAGAEDVEEVLTQHLDAWESGRAAEEAERETVQAGNAITKWAFDRASVRLVHVDEGEPIIVPNKLSA